MVNYVSVASEVKQESPSSHSALGTRNCVTCSDPLPDICAGSKTTRRFSVASLRNPTEFMGLTIHLASQLGSY